jgi:hypothetical protein
MHLSNSEDLINDDQLDATHHATEFKDPQHAFNARNNFKSSAT